METILKFYQLCILFVFFTAQSFAGEKPNVIIIYADDMGHGDISCQNPESKIKTPYLDKLASEGIRFTDGHSSSGICSPSRYALLTGNYHWRRQHGIVNSFGPSFFKPGELTIARMLKSKGYHTAAIGKWHLGWDWNSVKKDGAKLEGQGKRKYWGPTSMDWSKPVKGGPLDQGFDYYFGDGTINFPPYCWVENDKVTEAPTEILDLKGLKTKEGNWEFRPGPMVKDWNPYDVLPTLGKKAVEFINRQQADKPFFLYFALPSPHAPIIPNDEFDGKTEAGPYGDFIFQSDWIAGQVLDALKKKGLDENTMVIFSADNGPEKYAFERVRKYDHKSMGELRGLKRDTWEGGHRVPFIVKWPGKIKAGSVLKEVINQVDIMATLASVVDYKLPNESAVDSYNLLPVLKGEDYKKPLREATIQNTKTEQYVVRQGDWVLINSFSGEHSGAPAWFYEKTDYKKYSKKTTAGLLFNLKDDLAQRNDLYEKFPEKVKAMKALLKTYRSSGRSIPQR